MSGSTVTDKLIPMLKTSQGLKCLPELAPFVISLRRLGTQKEKRRITCHAFFSNGINIHKRCYCLFKKENSRGKEIKGLRSAGGTT